MVKVGVVDAVGLVLSAIGLLLMFATIDKIPEVIKAGRNIKVQKSDASLEVTTEKPLE